MLHKQSGASYLVILLVLIIVITTTKALVAIVPAYWDDHVLNNEIQNALSENDYAADSEQFHEKLGSRLSTQRLHHFNTSEILSVTDQGDQLVKKYEVTAHFFANINFLMRFEDSFSIQAAKK